MIEIRPQPGPQEQFLSTSADIAFYGGAAGGGKSFAALLEPLRHIKTVDGFGAVVFRRVGTQITSEGGLWDDSTNIYPHVGGQSREYLNEWTFAPHGNRVKFSHMEHEKNRFDWQGAQIPLIIFDELTHFTRKQFFYFFSRNRSMCGVAPYMRGTYNPVPSDDPVGGWIHEFVDWYIDEEGYPIPDRSGVIRWFVNVSDMLHWFDSKAEAEAEFPDIPPKSFTFIAANVFDNQMLLQRNPEYLANLKALDYIDQERLLRGNHKVRAEAGKVFDRGWFEIVDQLPVGLERHTEIVRFWDLAATEREYKRNEYAATAGVKMTRIATGEAPDGGYLWTYYVLDCVEQQFNPARTDTLLKNTASQDGTGVAQRWEEEGGASGKRDSSHIAQLLDGYDARGVRPTGDKLTRSRSLAAQALAGNVKLLRGSWNEAWLNHMHQIPDGARWDIHDASAGAYNELSMYGAASMRQAAVVGRGKSQMRRVARRAA